MVSARRKTLKVSLGIEIIGWEAPTGIIAIWRRRWQKRHETVDPGSSRSNRGKYPLNCPVSHVRSASHDTATCLDHAVYASPIIAATTHSPAKANAILLQIIRTM